MLPPHRFPALLRALMRGPQGTRRSLHPGWPTSSAPGTEPGLPEEPRVVGPRPCPALRDARFQGLCTLLGADRARLSSESLQGNVCEAPPAPASSWGKFQGHSEAGTAGSTRVQKLISLCARGPGPTGVRPGGGAERTRGPLVRWVAPSQSGTLTATSAETCREPL